MCSYLARGKCNSFLPVEQPQNFFLSQKIILRIVYSIRCVYLLVLELSENKDESWTFLAPSSNSSFEFLCKPVKPSNFYFKLEHLRDALIADHSTDSFRLQTPKFLCNYPVLFVWHLLPMSNCWRPSFQ